MKFRYVLPALVGGLLFGGLYWAGAQDGPGPDGGGSPGGSTFATQYKAANGTFGGTGPGTNGFVLTSRGAALSPTFQAAGSGTPAGSNTQLQFNDSGAFGASSLLTWVSPTLNVGVADVMVVHGSTITSQIQNNSDTQAIFESHTHSATNGPAFYGARSRGTNAAPTVVANNDNLLALSAVGYDGTDYELGGYMLFNVNGTPGSNDMPGNIQFATTADGAFTPTLRLTLGQDGIATFTGQVLTPASTTTIAGLNLPHGSAPSSPVNGDVWTTTSGMFSRINGATVGPFAAGSSLATTAQFVDDFYFIQGVADGTLTTDPVGNWTPAVGGVGDIELVTSSTILAGHPGVVRVNTGTGTTDNAGMVLSNGLNANPGSPNYILHATNETRVDCVVWIPVLPDGTQTYVASCGLARLALQSTTDNLVLGQVIWNGSAVRWNLKSSVSGGSSTSTAASTGPSATTWYQMTIIATTATVTLYIDGVQVATHSTNIPTANMGGHISVEKTAGTTARDFDVDLYVSKQTIASRLPGGL